MNQTYVLFFIIKVRIVKLKDISKNEIKEKTLPRFKLIGGINYDNTSSD